MKQKTPADAVADHVATNRTFYLNPEYKLPADATPDDAVASGVSPETRAWEWKGDESLHPFWAVQRLTANELSKRNFDAKSNHEFNVALKEKQFNVVTVGALAGQSVTETMTVTVPIMTNICAMEPGTELHMEVAPRPAVGSKRKPATWKDDVASAAKVKAAKTAATPKQPKPRPLEINSEV